MTDVDQDGSPSTDPLLQPFTPGMQGNPPELAELTRNDEIVPQVVIPLADVKTREFVEEWRNASYNCYSSGHKFCREVCPVMTETRNESWTPTAFHANVVAMERGELTHRGRRRRLRQLHAVRRLRAALPQHAVHGRLLQVPHAHRRRREGRAGARGRLRRPPAGLPVVERPHGGAKPRARARRSARRPGHGARLVGRPRHPDRR